MSVKHITTGQDSFLDIVANLVGVLIILVVVVGAQAKSAWTDVKPDEGLQAAAEELKEQLSRSADHVKKLEVDNHSLENQILSEASVIDSLMQVRHDLLVQTQYVQRDLEERKKTRNEKLNQQQRITASKQDQQQLLKKALTAVQSESRAVEVHKQKSEVIDHYPSPIAKTVFSDEVHFQLKAGKIVMVPLDELVSRMKTEWKVKAEKLQRAKSTVETVGPIDNFRLQYQLVAETVNQSIRGSNVQRQSVRFDRFEIFPARSNMGIDVDEALQSNSPFSNLLQRFVPAKTTVSVWVYPDSFGEYNQLKEYLYEAGYQVACWPLDFDRHISGGPNGFRTSAQ